MMTTSAMRGRSDGERSRQCLTRCGGGAGLSARKLRALDDEPHLRSSRFGRTGRQRCVGRYVRPVVTAAVDRRLPAHAHRGGACAATRGSGHRYASSATESTVTIPLRIALSPPPPPRAPSSRTPSASRPTGRAPARDRLRRPTSTAFEHAGRHRAEAARASLSVVLTLDCQGDGGREVIQGCNVSSTTRRALVSPSHRCLDSLDPRTPCCSHALPPDSFRCGGCPPSSPRAVSDRAPPTRSSGIRVKCVAERSVVGGQRSWTAAGANSWR